MIIINFSTTFSLQREQKTEVAAKSHKFLQQFTLLICSSARVNNNDDNNNIIKQKMNVTRSLLEDIKTKQLKWYGHVQRMEEGRLPRKVMKWSPPGRTKRGRPKLTWAEEIR